MAFSVIEKLTHLRDVDKSKRAANRAVVWDGTTHVYGNPATSGHDLIVTDDAKGLVLKDRTTGTYYRLYIDNGVLDIEALDLLTSYADLASTYTDYADVLASFSTYADIYGDA